MNINVNKANLVKIIIIITMEMWAEKNSQVNLTQLIQRNWKSNGKRFENYADQEKYKQKRESDRLYKK